MFDKWFDCVEHQRTGSVNELNEQLGHVEETGNSLEMHTALLNININKIGKFSQIISLPG